MILFKALFVKKFVSFRMRLSDFPSEILLDIFYCLANAELDNVRKAFPELNDIEESLKIQKTRIIVPFLRKCVNQSLTVKKLNHVLIKLFRTIDLESSTHNTLKEIFITCGPNCSPDEMRKLAEACAALGKKVPHKSIFYKKIDGVWYIDAPRIPSTGWMSGNYIKTTPERIKATILKHKRWIENITTKTHDFSATGIPVRTDMLYFTNMSHIINP